MPSGVQILLESDSSVFSGSSRAACVLETGRIGLLFIWRAKISPSIKTFVRPERSAKKIKKGRSPHKGTPDHTIRQSSFQVYWSKLGPSAGGLHFSPLAPFACAGVHFEAIIFDCSVPIDPSPLVCDMPLYLEMSVSFLVLCYFQLFSLVRFFSGSLQDSWRLQALKSLSIAFRLDSRYSTLGTRLRRLSEYASLPRLLISHTFSPALVPFLFHFDCVQSSGLSFRYVTCRVVFTVVLCVIYLSTRTRC